MFLPCCKLLFLHVFEQMLFSVLPRVVMLSRGPTSATENLQRHAQDRLQSLDIPIFLRLLHSSLQRRICASIFSRFFATKNRNKAYQSEPSSFPDRSTQGASPPAAVRDVPGVGERVTCKGGRVCAHVRGKDVSWHKCTIDGLYILHWLFYRT